LTLFLHPPDAELGTLTARRLADALHAAAEVDWRDGDDVIE
jgi:hypothetical protein